MTTETMTVEIPADVRDNSEKVTDYAFARHMSTFLTPPTPGERDRDILYADFFGYTHYQWHDTAPGGQRCRFDMMVNRAGEMMHLHHTEYFTRVACYQGWCASYAAHFVTTSGGFLPVTDPVPACGECVRNMRRSFAGSPVTLNLSEPLLIGQHD